MNQRQELHEEERRSQIIRAARKCFSEKGFHGTSMRSIFAEAKLSSGSFYNYFTSKTEVVREVCSQDQMALVYELEKMSSSENPIEAIGRLQQNLFWYCYKTDPRMWVEIYAEACRDLDIRAVCDATEAPIRKAIEATVAKARTQGLLTSEFSNSKISANLMAICWGSISKAAFQPNTDPDAEGKLCYQNTCAILRYSGSNNSATS
jgi:TetR/AcrR family transcriptional regulator, repressor for uid operon